MSADDKDELGGRMADLEKGLEVGLNEMEKKIEAVQQGLTDRVTQMEVAITGAIKKSGGGRDERSHSNAGLLAPPTANGTLDNEEDSFRMSEDKAVELARTGHSVLMMQGLVDGDTEIRSLMQGLRTRSNRAKLTRTATTNLSGEDMKKSSRCCPTADSPGGRSLRGCLKVVFCNIPVLHPDHRFRSLWNAALALLILYCGIAIPLEVAFEDDMIYAMCDIATNVTITNHIRSDCPSFTVWFAFNVLVDMWFIFDVFLNLRTGYTVEGHFVKDDVLAMRHYIREGSFFFDLLGSFPLNYVFLAFVGEQAATDARANRMVRMLRLAKLVKLARMVKLSVYLEYVEVVIKFNPGLLRMFKLIIWAILCCHWFGCIWWLISDIEIKDARYYDMPNEDIYNEWHPPHWLKYSDDLSLKYWSSFYWGAGIALSMVPNDIVPMTTVENIFTTAMMFVGLLLAAFVISSLTSAFAAMDSTKQLTGKQLDVIRNYLLLKGVNQELRARILEYYQYIFTSSMSMDDLRVLQHMPLNLSTQLAISINAKIIAKCHFFNSVSDASLAALINALSPSVFVPGQIIVTEGQPLRHIYFINRGRIQLLRDASSDNETVVRVLVENDNLGLDDFAPRLVSHTARALGYCDVMSLSTEELATTLEHDSAIRVKKAQAAAAAGPPAASPAEPKKNLSNCLRKAHLGVKMSNALRGARNVEGTSTSSRRNGSVREDVGSSREESPRLPAPAQAPTAGDLAVVTPRSFTESQPAPSSPVTTM